jgi:hypothetical protein
MPPYIKRSCFREIDRKGKLKVDGRFWKSIIRPTSGAVETENSLVNKELCEIRQRLLQFIEAQKELVGRFGSINVSILSSKAEKKRC